MPNTFLDQTPIRMGTKEEFACVARTLKDASFDEETICRTFDLKDMSKVGLITSDKVAGADVSPQLKVLTRLFLLPALASRSEVESVFEQATIDSFLSLGLLGTGEFGNDDFYARALLYPVAGFIIASDRHSLPDESEFEPPPDVVFPAIFGGTLEFLRVLPRNWKGAALDLCSGSGVAAFAMSRSGQEVVSTDITERAAAFARFNCALNDINNVEVLRGDLYEAVQGRTFGCIVAHPPYVPSLETKAIWRDGGITGEALVKRIIEELPQYLDRGGVFLCVSLGADTQEGKFEERVRGWLGKTADEFQVVFACKELREPRQVLDNLARKYSELGPQIIEKFESEFRRAGVVQMPIGALWVRRIDGSKHQPWTTRRRLTDETDGADFEAAFSMHDRLSQPNFLASLEEATPRLSPRLEVKVTHVVHEGSLVPADFLFEIDKPFDAHVRFDSWMVPLLARLDGKTTLAKIYEDARAEGSVPEEFKLENFAVLVSRAVEIGFIECLNL